MQPKVHRGQVNAKGSRFAVVVSRWNDFLTSKLSEGAISALETHGVDETDVEVFMVPGAFELPLTSLKLANSGNFDAVIALGVVIRGETPHFDYVAGEAAKGIAQAGMTTGIPVIFGVVTTDTLEQAINRCGGKAGNKGYEAAVSAIEVVNLHREIENSRKNSNDKALHNVV
ncbi:MAG: 6,7-dimethyl-8-ribityllumazine synthase [Acidobacteria bacterium]|nr:6,7-dimethyl-8-ribityllumazine synthase [Acidobacteriota bacterium]